MVNVEIVGIVGIAQIGSDKQGRPVQKLTVMTDQGKMMKLTAETVQDTIASLKNGTHIAVRCENVSMIISEYGNLIIKCDHFKVNAQQMKAAA